MRISRDTLYRLSFYSGFASALAILISITISQYLLGLSLAALLASGNNLRLPRIWLPLLLFIAGTVTSMILSPAPSHGLPQIVKIFVFSTLLVIFSTVRDVITARRLVLGWAGIAAAASLVGIAQFAHKLHQARVRNVSFYQFYNDDRITGFMSHWMTFAGQQMIVLLMLFALLFFAPGLTRKTFLALATCAGVLGIAILLNGTRTVWLGSAAAGIWLCWHWSRRMAIGAPMALLLLVWLIPGPVHDRFMSIFQPQANVDSNDFRKVAFQAGVRMIQSSPWVGIGLDETKYRMMDYISPDTPRPLPPGFYQHLHNVYLQYAAERGIATMLTIVWMLALCVYDFLRKLRELPPGRSNERFLLQGGIATVIGIMISGLFEVNLGDTEVLTVFLVVVACAYVAVYCPAAFTAITSSRKVFFARATSRSTG